LNSKKWTRNTLFMQALLSNSNWGTHKPTLTFLNLNIGTHKLDPYSLNFKHVFPLPVPFSRLKLLDFQVAPPYVTSKASSFLQHLTKHNLFCSHGAATSSPVGHILHVPWCPYTPLTCPIFLLCFTLTFQTCSTKYLIS
jgi:hypothetical protein